MSHNNRNFAIAYILLVALPVLGLVGVLKRGRSLSAPISVDGAWKLQADSSRLAVTPCGKFLASITNTAIIISQSGRNFTLSVANSSIPTGAGVIEGNTIKIAFSLTDAEMGCKNGHALSLTATVDTKADPRSLVGMLSVNGCSSCTPVEIYGLRQASAGKKGAP